MNQTNYKKLFSLIAFTAFAAVSCWATAESLHLLLPAFPKVMCWVVTVGFFIIASIGTKMITDSISQNIYVERRGSKLILGILILLMFWLICSMPTNTHTFFYRNIINDKVNTDISSTRGYLGQIKNNTNNKNQATIKINELRNDVDILLDELEAEIKNEANPGFGPKSNDILRKLAAQLGVDKIEPLTYQGLSVQERNKLCNAYRKKVLILTDSKATNLMSHILSPNQDNLKEVKLHDENLTLVKKYIDDGTINLNDAKDITDVCDKLNVGYNTVKKNQNFVNFASENDKAKYTADNPITEVKRITSVFDVWIDYLKGNYNGYGFTFWIIISILVDIAAFIFFDIAFKESEY
ncbi:hypothetical protein [Parabacteroides distasonis]|mgnify:CR=1 FL=1|uniref:DUF4407 domain-containing protein n=1 Tax=Parabacteroides distasonis TaxID=823 RepID=A0A4S2F4F0_PARDI|nr:hypothetical protein [Parabacteroides distasonis]TGY63859.1 hypothetical protein E5342_00450 [Parabacteroides distasonis]